MLTTIHAAMHVWNHRCGGKEKRGDFVHFLTLYAGILQFQRFLLGLVLALVRVKIMVSQNRIYTKHANAGNLPEILKKTSTQRIDLATSVVHIPLGDPDWASINLRDFLKV